MQNKFEELLENYEKVYQDTSIDLETKNELVKQKFKQVEDFIQNEETKQIIQYSKMLWQRYLDAKNYFTWFLEDLEKKQKQTETKEEMSQILPFLYLGSQENAENQQLLLKYGITHILNISVEVENKFENKFQYLQVKIYDSPKETISKHFSKCFDFINQCQNNEKFAKNRCLVHCVHGISRSATIVIAYLMKLQSIDFETSYSIVKKLRPQIKINDGFLSELQSFQYSVKNT